MRCLWQTSAAKVSVVLLALASCQATQKVDTSHEPSPVTTVEASSRVMHMSDSAWLVVEGTNLNSVKLHFDPPLPESKFHRQVLCSTYLAIVKIRSAADPGEPILWRAEPGPLKVVAIESEDGLVELIPPEGGGVVVAEILADHQNIRNVRKPPPPRLMKPEESPVSVLSEDTIEDFVRAAGFAVVQFYSADTDSPELVKASIELKRFEPNIKLGRIDMEDTNRSLQKRFGVWRDPTIKIFHNGVEVSSLVGSGDAAKIVDYLDYLMTEKKEEVGVARPRPLQTSFEALPPPLHLPPLKEPEDSRVSVLSEDTIDDFIRASEFAVVAIFYADPESRLLSPEYTEASIELKRLFFPAVKLGKVDMTIDRNRPLLERFGVHRYPAIKTFHNGVEVSSLLGSIGAAGIVDYLITEKAKQDGVAPIVPMKFPPRHLPPSLESEHSAVSVLSLDTIDHFISADFAVVQFYMPDCPHCASLLPEYTKASLLLQRVYPDIKLGRIDMTNSISRFNEQLSVHSIPTIKVFHHGVEVPSAVNGRDAPKIVDQLEIVKAKQDGVEASAVRFLSKDTFDDFIQTEFAVVAFYTPYSIKCLMLHPEYTAASIELRRLDPDIKLGMIAVTDDTNRPLAERFDVRAFPTFKIFRNGVVSDYSAPSEAGPIVETLLAEKAKQDGVAHRPPPLKETGESEVSVLSVDTIFDFIGADFAVVEFYHPTLSRCQRLAPEYTWASVNLRGLDPAIKLGKIDIVNETNRPLMERFGLEPFGVQEIPAFKIFHNGAEVLGQHLTRARDAAGIVNYLINAKATEDGVPAPAPTPLLPRPPALMEPEDSEVSVLSADTIEDFISAAEFAVVEFYMPKSPYCVKLFPEYTKASIELKRVDPAMKLGKIDMTDGFDRLSGLFGDVHLYPTTKVFHNGVEVSSLLGSRDAAEIVKYLITEKATEMMMPTEGPGTLFIDASDIEIFRGRTQELLMTGNGFSEANPPELRFEHALNRGVKTDVVNSTTIRVDLRAASSGWTILDGHVGPLKIKGIAAGPIRKVVHPGITVATVMPDFGASESDAQFY